MQSVSLCSRVTLGVRVSLLLCFTQLFHMGGRVPLGARAPLLLCFGQFISHARKGAPRGWGTLPPRVTLLHRGTLPSSCEQTLSLAVFGGKGRFLLRLTKISPNTSFDE